MTRHWTLRQLADEFALQLHGNGETIIRGAAPLDSAGPDHLAFMAHPRLVECLAGSRAGGVIVTAEFTDVGPAAKLIAENPAVAFAHVAAKFETAAVEVPGIHPSAVIDGSARIDAAACIGPLCVIERNSTVAAGAMIGAGCHIGPDCTVGTDCRLLPRVTLVRRVQLGQRVLIHSGAVLGSDGFGLAFDTDHWVKIPQLGRVCVGDDCEIGANTCIDLGALADTVLENDVRLDNLIHIAHNVHIGAHTAMAGCSAVAGSARIGKYCQIGGGVGILGHISIADRVTITAMSLVTHSIHQAGTWSASMPLQDNRLWRRNAVRLKHLDELARRVAKLEKDTVNE